MVAGDCSVPKLPVLVVTPAFQGPVVKDGAGVGIACYNGDRGPTRAKVNENRIVLISSGCSIAQLSGVVATPTRERTVVKNGTGMVRPDVEGHRRSACAEINGR